MNTTKMTKISTVITDLPAQLQGLAFTVWKGTNTQAKKKAVELTHFVDGERHVGAMNLVIGKLPARTTNDSRPFVDLIGDSEARSLAQLRDWFRPADFTEREVSRDTVIRRTEFTQGTSNYRLDTLHWMGSDGESNTSVSHVCPHIAATAHVSASYAKFKKVYITVYHQRPLSLAEALLFREVGFSESDQVALDVGLQNHSITQEQFEEHLISMTLHSYQHRVVVPRVDDEDESKVTFEEVQADVGAFGILPGESYEAWDTRDRAMRARFPIIRERALALISIPTGFQDEVVYNLVTGNEEQDALRAAGVL